MKLTQFALAAIVVLLAVAGYLTIKSDFDSRLEAQNAINDKLVKQLDQIDKKLQAPAPVPAVPAPAPAPAPAPLVPDISAAPVPAVPKAPLSPEAAAAIKAADEISPDDPVLNRIPPDDPRLMEEEQEILKTAGAGTGTDRVAPEPPVLPSSGDGAPLTTIQRRILAAPPIATVKHYAEKEGMIVLDKGADAKLRAGDTFALRRGNAVIGKVRVSETIEATESIADVVEGSMPAGMQPAKDDQLIKFGE